MLESRGKLLSIERGVDGSEANSRQSFFLQLAHGGGIGSINIDSLVDEG